ncbi:hypothetical protein H5410_041425 [Solanum commersonii]|uniref:Uncharacterized protein n=1 Tax=Solanum commersonii TaxID=4109 RepID=A0A9J5XTK8_SOLCO|nr:hypothetical protein H5410_041425 [Solanum commersonii]
MECRILHPELKKPFYDNKEVIEGDKEEGKVTQETENWQRKRRPRNRAMEKVDRDDLTEVRIGNHLQL